MTNFDNEEDLDDEFPLGEGTADTSATVNCPYCNEPVEISLDAGSGGTQEYVEDCQVCCQPWTVSVRYGADGSATVSVVPLDG
jgi:Cysteine-rich CPXCG